MILDPAAGCAKVCEMNSSPGRPPAGSRSEDFRLQARRPAPGRPAGYIYSTCMHGLSRTVLSPRRVCVVMCICACVTFLLLIIMAAADQRAGFVVDRTPAIRILVVHAFQVKQTRI
jgi:hypothetical protein